MTRNRENYGICHVITCGARTWSYNHSYLSPAPDPRDAEIARLKAEGAMLADKAAAAIRELTVALAACAELRAALESVVSMVDVDATDGYIMAVDRARALLSRTDLGAGMAVVVPREDVDASALGHGSTLVDASPEHIAGIVRGKVAAYLLKVEKLLDDDKQGGG